jgi:hypothetical protein
LTRKKEAQAEPSPGWSESAKLSTTGNHDEYIARARAWLNGAPHEWWNDLAKTYPTIDAPAEIRKALAWLSANPSKRKACFARFLRCWLARSGRRRAA